MSEESTDPAQEPFEAERSVESRKKKRKKRRKQRNALREYERMARFLEGDGGANMSTVGMAPAFATAESMLTASQAQGQMMLGAVANQNRFNSVAMVVLLNGLMQMQRLGNSMVAEEEDDFDDDMIDRLVGRFTQ